MPSKILSLIGLAALVGAAASAPLSMKPKGMGSMEANEARRLYSSEEDGDDNVPETPTPVEAPETPTPVGTPEPVTTTEDDDDSLPAHVFLGCYVDEPSARIMTEMTTIYDLTTEFCSDLCAGNAYFGTQYGNECWCGGDDTDFDQHGTSESCDYQCAGDGNEICGGFYAMSVYTV